MDFDRKVGEDKFKIGDLKKFVVEWNNNHPLDYWWRDKYSVPFGSLRHLEMDFVDMRVDYEEDLILERMKKGKDVANDIVLEEGKEIIVMTDKEIDDEFENLDLNKYKT